MTVFATGGRARTMDFQAGDVGYVLKTLPHYVQNTGDTDLKFLEMFKSSFTRTWRSRNGSRIRHRNWCWRTWASIRPRSMPCRRMRLW
jgi:mannose-6-phosphate isomerase-like protein (cupin superfamily)